MARVPYEPYPTVDPIAGTGGRSISVQAIPAAFGATVAQATEHLGQVTERAGNEMFQRAEAFQQLKNETEATEADTRYMIAAGELHADYSSKQGKDAVDAYPGYQKALADTRTKIRDGLSNPMAQKMYDRASLTTMGRTIFNGAGHAAAEQKHWATGTANAELDINIKTVEDNPTDENLFQDKRRRVIQSAQQIGTLKGFEAGGPEERDLVLNATSKIRAQQLIGLSRTKPFEAAAALDKFKKELTDTDFARVDNTVRAQGRAVGSVNIANDVWAEGQGDEAKKIPAKSYEQMVGEVRAKAAKQNPDDPLLATHAMAAFQSLYNQNKYAEKQENYDNNQTIATGIIKGAKNEQELRTDPRVAAAIDALPESERLSIPGRINRYNEAKDKAANQDTYDRLWGMAHNNVEGFLNTDVTKAPLSQPQIEKLWKLQQDLKKNPYMDPRVDRAKATLRGSMSSQLEALGIYNRTQQNKDDYDHYTGALSSAIDAWTDAHGKPPTADDVKDKIGPEVIKQRTRPTWFGWSSEQVPFYKQEVPPEYAAGLKAEVVAKGGSEPTEEQIYQAFIRQQFIDLYGKKGSAVPSKEQGQVK